MACILLIQLDNMAHHISKSVIIITGRKVKNYEQPFEISETFSVKWKTTNKIHNSL